VDRLSPVAARPFQLTRYFTLTSLVAFGVLAAALYFLQSGEINYFAKVDRAQNAMFAQVQAELLAQQKDTARSNLVHVHEAGQVALAKVFANALWPAHFAPLVAQARGVRVETCRSADDPRIADVEGPSADPCVARVHARIASLPAFAGLDEPVRTLMQSTSIFKIKVFDMRGLTVYSSDPQMIGEDKSEKAGWQAAVAGRITSELARRVHVRTYGSVIRDRDLIQTFVPMRLPDGAVGGVFEIYSDVTEMLLQLEGASARGAAIIANNQRQMRQVAAENLRAVESASDRFLLTIYCMLLATYVVLLFFVRGGQRIIDREERARGQAAVREQEWHRDKMSTMGAMAANISHNVGNPLAIISGLAEEISHSVQSSEAVNPEFPSMIVEQTVRIATMTRRISRFASAGRDAPELVDINECIKSVCEFLRFDRRFHGSPIQLELGAGLPHCLAIPDHLTEVVMGLLQALEQGCDGCTDARLRVTTSSSNGEVLVRIKGDCPSGAGTCGFPLGDPRLESARRRMEGMQGRVEPAGNMVEIVLPVANAGTSSAQ
jgi:signal transduction histidine kinase